jgi:hypothetical protein
MEESLKIRPGVAEWREVESEVVGIDTRTATYFALNRTGALLWPALIAGTTRPVLVERLCTEFGIAPEAAAGDVDAFLKVLADQDMLDAASGVGSSG